MGKSKSTKVTAHISNMFTMGNMAAGLLSILLLLHDSELLLIASGLIMLGGIFDFFDGFYARKYNTVSDMGKQLDSFADIITFGVAPLVLLNILYSSIWTMIPSLIFLLAGAFRLARYNLGDFEKHFIGLPIPASGLVLTFFCTAQLLWLSDIEPYIGAIITKALVIFLSVAMVSKKKVKRLV